MEGHFLERYWGDVVGLFLVLMGVALVVGAAWFTAAPDVERVAALGGSLVIGGMALLRPKPNPKNGNGVPPTPHP